MKGPNIGNNLGYAFAIEFTTVSLEVFFVLIGGGISIGVLDRISIFLTELEKNMFVMAASLKRCTVEKIRITFMQEVVTYLQINSAGVQSPRQQMSIGGTFDRHSKRSERGDGVWTIKSFFVKNVSGGSLNDGVESKRAQAVGSRRK